MKLVRQCSVLLASPLLLILFVSTAASCHAANDPALDKLPPRRAWANTGLNGSPDPPMPMQAKRIFPNLVLQHPVALRDLPGRDYRLVLQRNGKLLTFARRDDADETYLAIDLAKRPKRTADEEFATARDVALDPDFEENGWVYVIWTTRPQLVDEGTRIMRYTLNSASPPTIDPQSELEIITYPSGDHIGTSLRFGPDGFFYITTGDGASPFPPDEHKTAQDVGDLRGGVLRIDVHRTEGGRNYAIPKDNPFVSVPGARGEVYAYGIRNGFRSAFRPGTGSFWVADVGWEQCEMVHRIVKGGNHGWSLYEGPFPVEPNQPKGPGLDGKPSQRIPPAIVLFRNEAQSITGGVFAPEPSLLNVDGHSIGGNYLFGCYMNGGVWAADVTDEDNPVVRKIAETGLRIIDFTTTQLEQTPEGHSEILVLDFGRGGVYQLEPSAASTAETKPAKFATQLSETGLFVDTATHQLAPEVLIYEPAATMNRNGAVGSRFVAITGKAKIKARGRWTPPSFPQGSVIGNTLTRPVISPSGSVELVRIETQLLVFDGLNWDPYTYRWNEDQTDANLVHAAGDQRELLVPDQRLGNRKLTHVFAARAQCAMCHHVGNQAGPTLTPESLHGQPGVIRNNEDRPVVTSWQQLVAAGYAWNAQPKDGILMAAPFSSEASLDDRARSYLAMNCRHCHMPGGGGRVALNFDRERPTADIHAVGRPVEQGAFGIKDAKIIWPGHPERSVLTYRTATAGPGRMPKISHGEPDVRGAKLIWDWIASMTPEATTSPDRVTASNEINGDEAETSLSGNTTSTNSQGAGTAAALLKWREVADMPPLEARRSVARMLEEASDPILRGLFEPWVALDQRVSKVGDKPDVERLLAMPGDATRGEVWFKNASSAQCRTCHRVDGTKPLIGPSLDGIASKRTRRDLLDQMIYPSRQIEPAWKTYQVLTVDGDLVSGLLVEKSDEAWVIRGTDGKEVRLLADDVESVQPNAQSMMPDGLLAPMTPQEVADLLAYLETLKK